MLACLSQADSKKSGSHRVLATNRRAKHEYELLEELECGIALTGTEVKSLRQGKCSIDQSYALIRDGELFLIGHAVSNLDQGWGGPPSPEVLWDVPVVVSWLEGMTIVEAEVVNRPVDTEEGRRHARDALIRARVS